MNNLNKEDITKIALNYKNDLKEEELTYILNKSNYKKENAKKLKLLIDEICVNNNEVINSLWYNYYEVLINGLNNCFINNSITFISWNIY